MLILRCPAPAAPSRFRPPLLLSPLRRTPTLPCPRGLARGARPSLHHHVALPPGADAPAPEAPPPDPGPSSAAAVAAAIRLLSAASPVEFTRRPSPSVGQDGGGLVAPSPDFRRLCAEQLELFRVVVHREAVLSVYVRPAGSYIMDQLELYLVVLHEATSGPEVEESTLLIGNFTVPAGLRAAEAALVKQQLVMVHEFGAAVLPLVKHPFVVGFLVAEFPKMEIIAIEDSNISEQKLPSSVANGKTKNLWEIQSSSDDLIDSSQHAIEWRSRAIMISNSLATAYVMDQKALLLQQTAWQHNVRMGHLAEQIRGPLSSIRTLAKMLSVNAKKTEIPYDIVEDIIIQGDHMKDTLQQMQEAVHFTKANIVRYNEETLKKIQSLPEDPLNLKKISNEANGVQDLDGLLPWESEKDAEMPMPPLWLTPLQQSNARSCDVVKVLKELVEAALPLAYKQQRVLATHGLANPLEVAVEEPALRQALSNLIEGALLRTQSGGKVDIFASGAPAGGTLVIIDDEGPNMQYMTQAHSLAPFGAELVTEGMVQDNMTWNFVAGLTVASEILENYGCVVRVISPRKHDGGAMGSGGTRVEVWLPTLQASLGPVTINNQA